VLIIELVDNASWELVIQLASVGGLDQHVDRFGAALAEAQLSCPRARGWLAREFSGEVD